VYTGWVLQFKHGTHVQPRERAAQLKQNERYKSSDNFACLIRFNSAFIEIIDRRFRQRGMIATVFTLLAFTFFLGVWLYALRDTLGQHARGRDPAIGFFLFVSALVAGTNFFFWRIFLGKEFFTHTHYPIRFNRKSRMVHAYRDKRDGGIVSVSWDKAFFHIGAAVGEDMEFLRDIRCHVIDDQDKILDTFAVGHYFDDEHKIRSVFEFIRRFMEEGPENVFEDPSTKAAKIADDLVVPLRRIDLSVTPSLRNCFNWVVAAMPERWFEARYVLIPLYAPLFLCRWLVFKTCKAPKWPAAIAAESAIEPNDPYRLEEPTVHVQWGDV
jgi:hypothetical protein